MSNLDDLEDFERLPRSDVTPGKFAEAARSNFRKREAAAKQHKIERESLPRLRLSAHEPSLPKLKFLEGKDK